MITSRTYEAAKARRYDRAARLNFPRTLIASPSSKWAPVSPFFPGSCVFAFGGPLEPKARAIKGRHERRNERRDDSRALDDTRP